ncbi:MAG: uracil-DNA glycosylase [Candidatus Nanoarchaeia archaeon]|nr:uracil-DNA glycosylase [Candidatus Nanoarchaeia archaeon]
MDINLQTEKIKKSKNIEFENKNFKNIEFENIEFQKFKEKWKNCSKCKELVENRTNIVFGDGNPNPKIVFIGEAPGDNEDKKGKAFVGRSGKELDKLLEKINLTRNDVYIMNVLMCRPPKNRNPKSEEIKNCHERFYEQIKTLNPKIIVTLGNFSTQKILETKEPISKLHGKIQKKNELTIIPTFHPATILYSGGNNRKIMEEDFMIIKDFLNNNTNYTK